MWEIEPFIFDNLRTAKQMADGGLLKVFLEDCGRLDVDSEDYYEISWCAMLAIFPDMNSRFNEERGIETIIICDPLIDELSSLCDSTEFDRIVHADLLDCFLMDGSIYDYDLRFYDGGHGRSRAVILMGEEFYGFPQLPRCLADLREGLEYHVKRLQKEKRLKLLPPAGTRVETGGGDHRKEAA